MIDVFLVDDDEDYAESLKKRAILNDIRILNVCDLQKMKEYLPKVISGISMIILDIKGKYSKTDKLDDESFLIAAMKYLNNKYPNKPRVILTGDTEGYKIIKNLFKDEKLYRKDNESEEDMFDYITEVHSKLDIYEIKKQFSEIFDMFIDEKFPAIRQEELITLIQKKDSDSPSDIKDSLGRIRDFQEDIIRHVNKLKIDYLPDSKSKNGFGEISFTKSNTYLEKNQKETYPEFVSKSAMATYKIGCKYGIHTDGAVEEQGLTPSPYTVNNALYSLFDLILWYKSIVC